MGFLQYSRAFHEFSRFCYEFSRSFYEISRVFWGFLCDLLGFPWFFHVFSMGFLRISMVFHMFPLCFRSCQRPPAAPPPEAAGGQLPWAELRRRVLGAMELPERKAGALESLLFLVLLKVIFFF